MNKELDKYLEERKEELKTIRQQSQADKPTSGELSNEEEDRSFSQYINMVLKEHLKRKGKYPKSE